MDCPICMDPITNQTGQVTTSCGHTFHFKCLNTWYWRQTQEEDGQETCPCCRKEPGDFERASTVTESEAESQSIAEWTVDEEPNEWIRVGPGRWIVPSSEPERLQILAQVAADQAKMNELHIPPYSPENHALYQLRHLFDEPNEPTAPSEPLNNLDRPKMVRRRRRSWGRTFWCHLGNEYKLTSIDGYKSD